MDNQPIDKLLDKKIKAARRGRILGSLLLILAVLAVVGCAYMAVRHYIQIGAGDDTTGSDPGQTEEPTSSSEAPSTDPPETDDPTQTTDADDPSQTTDVSETTQPSETDDPAQTTERDTREPKPERKKHEMQIVWTDETDAPDSVTIRVLYGESVLFTTALSREGDWYYAWEDECPARELRLEGDFPDAVSVTYTVSGEDFTLKAASLPGDLPQTGTYVLVGLLMMLAGIVITFVSFAARAEES